MNIGYLGPEGSYSNLAAQNMCKGEKLIAFASFPLAFAALTGGGVDGIVVPIENTLNGGVLQVIDLLQETENVCAVSEITLKIEHRLAVKAGARLADVERVYSHPQALEQCAKYLYKNLPQAKLVSTLSTAASLTKVKSASDACIVGAHIEREGIVLLDDDIADNGNNFTHFLLIRRGSLDISKPTQKIYFSVTGRNVSGGLLAILQRVAAHGLNMAKIESRPVKDAPAEFRFFIETEGDYSKPEVRAALDDIVQCSLSFKLLGAY